MPYWRLSGVYFSYFAVVGAFSPYWSLYLQALNFSAQQIGVLSAVPLLTKLLAPNLWSWFADATGQRLTVIRYGSFGACLFFVGLLFLYDYSSLIVLLALYSIFWNAVLPQFEAITLTYLRDKAHEYSKIRVWGSIGFIVTVLLLGVFFEYFSIQWLPHFILLFLIGIFIFACLLPPEDRQLEPSRMADFLKIMMGKYVLIFYFVLFLLQFSHGVYYVFYSIYLESYGYSKTLIGVLWTIGVVSEIYIFIKMPEIFSRFSRFQLLSWSLFLTALRWCLMALFASSAPIIVFAQLLHAFSFGVMHAVAIDFIKTTFGESSHGQAQAFYAAVTFGGGASLGAFVSGLLWQSSPQLTFLVAAGAAFFSWLLAIVFLKMRL